jgi:hypothetical protein
MVLNEQESSISAFGNILCNFLDLFLAKPKSLSAVAFDKTSVSHPDFCPVKVMPFRKFQFFKHFEKLVWKKYSIIIFKNSIYMIYFTNGSISNIWVYYDFISSASVSRG